MLIRYRTHLNHNCYKYYNRHMQELVGISSPLAHTRGTLRNLARLHSTGVGDVPVAAVLVDSERGHRRNEGNGDGREPGSVDDDATVVDDGDAPAEFFVQSLGNRVCHRRCIRQF